MRGTFADKEKKKEKKKAKTVEQTATTVNKKPGQVRWAKFIFRCISGSFIWIRMMFNSIIIQNMLISIGLFFKFCV